MNLTLHQVLLSVDPLQTGMGRCQQTLSAASCQPSLTGVEEQAVRSSMSLGLCTLSKAGRTAPTALDATSQYRSVLVIDPSFLAK